MGKEVASVVMPKVVGVTLLWLSVVAVVVVARGGGTCVLAGVESREAVVAVGKA